MFSREVVNRETCFGEYKRREENRGKSNKEIFSEIERSEFPVDVISSFIEMNEYTHSSLLYSDLKKYAKNRGIKNDSIREGIAKYLVLKGDNSLTTSYMNDSTFVSLLNKKGLLQLEKVMKKYNDA